jgi:hypothetical protein
MRILGYILVLISFAIIVLFYITRPTSEYIQIIEIVGTSFSLIFGVTIIIEPYIFKGIFK